MAKKKVEVYDFREGLDSSRIVYKDTSRCNCSDFLKYIGYLLATWIYAAAWFALFFYAWWADRHATFITFIVVWGVFMAIMIFGFFLPNLLRYYESERKIKQAKELEEKEKEDKSRQDIANANRDNKTKPNHQPLRDEDLNDNHHSRSKDKIDEDKLEYNNNNNDNNEKNVKLINVETNNNVKVGNNNLQTNNNVEVNDFDNENVESEKNLVNKH